MSRQSAFMRLDFALSMQDEGDLVAAIEAAQAAISALPNEAQFHFVLGELYQENGQIEEAIASFQKALELQDEDCLGAEVKLSLLGALPELTRLPAPYVEALFDDYAPRFEKNLVKHLSYRAPEQLFELIFSHLSKLPTKPRILDLGCGTGLVGEQLRVIARYLEGVDLSEKMLKQAARKKIYDKLVHGDIEAEIDLNAPRFDMVVACDVFNYLGDLSQLFHKIARRLSSGGVLAFSVESSDNRKAQKAFNLHPGQRYVHDRQAIMSWLSAAGYDVLEERFAPLRIEKGDPVEGHLVFARLKRLPLQPQLIEEPAEVSTKFH